MKIREDHIFRVTIILVLFFSIFLNTQGITNTMAHARLMNENSSNSNINSDNNNNTISHYLQNVNFPAKIGRVSTTNQVKGGNNFTSATEIYVGSINGSFDSNDGRSEYFKVNLNAPSTIIFTAIVDPSLILSIYNPSEQLIGSDNSKDILHVQIIVGTAGYYYVGLNRPDLTLNTNFTLTISDPLNGPAGSSSLNTAVLITPGTFSSNFSSSQSDQYFKIYLTNGTDIYINAFGEYSNLYFYNSSGIVLDQNTASNMTLKHSISLSDYYFIRVSYVTTTSAIFTLTIENKYSGAINYVDGGDSFASATLIPTGTTQNQITSIEGSDYFKVPLNISFIATLTLTALSPTVTPNTYLYFYVYQPDQIILTYGQVFTTQAGVIPSVNKLVITPTQNDTYYLVINYDYPLAYKITVTQSDGGTDGGNTFASATTITSGAYTGYLTNDELSDYYKIKLTAGYDVNIIVTGECDSVFLYNSTTYLIEESGINPFILYSISATDFYFIQLFHSTSKSGNYSLSIINKPSGSILYIDGGDSFNSASSIPIGTVQDYITSSEGSDYFKVQINSSQIVTFTLQSLSLPPTTNTYLYFYIYNSNQTQLAYYRATTIYTTALFSTIYLYITNRQNATYYLRVSYAYYLSYKINMLTRNDSLDGGNDFSSATQLTSTNASYSGYLTSEETNDYYKIQLERGYDIVINSYYTMYFYNNSKILLEKMSSFKRSIFSTGYYFIRFNHSTTSLGYYSFTVTIQRSGSIFFVDGGDSINNASLIPAGIIQGSLIYNEKNDYFKIFSNDSQVIVFDIFTLTYIYSAYYDFYVYIYDQNNSLLNTNHFYNGNYVSAGTKLRLFVSSVQNQSFYLRLSSNYSLNYRIQVFYTFYPSEPTNIHVDFSNNAKTITISWLDSVEKDLTYLIYRDTFPITRINNSFLNFKTSSPKSINLILIGKVASGIQQFTVFNPPVGTYYYAVIANNSAGLTSVIELGISATNAPIQISYPNQLTTSTNSIATSSQITSTIPLTNGGTSTFTYLVLLIVVVSLLLGGFAVYYNKNHPKNEREAEIQNQIWQDDYYNENQSTSALADRNNQEQKDDLERLMSLGNFENFDQFIEAQQLGASNLQTLKIIKELHAPNYETARKILEGKFENMEQYTEAQLLGAKNLDELTLVKSTNAPDYSEASKVQVSGFSDYKSYKEALSEGFKIRESWELFQKRKQRLSTYINGGVDVSREEFMTELELIKTDELLTLLDNLNVPLQGSHILFSDFKTQIDPSSIIKTLSNTHTTKLYQEYEFKEFEQSNQELENCKICFRPLVGIIGSCPKCLNDMHYACLSNWVISHNSCPTCRQQINMKNIIILDRGKLTACSICKNFFHSNDKVIRCENCSSNYHKAEFLEWVKVKGSCPNCSQKIKF